MGKMEVSDSCRQTSDGDKGTSEGKEMLESESAGECAFFATASGNTQLSRSDASRSLQGTMNYDVVATFYRLSPSCVLGGLKLCRPMLQIKQTTARVIRATEETLGRQ